MQERVVFALYMFPALTLTQRQAITQNGTPLPMIDNPTGTTYILLEVALRPAFDQDGFTAYIPGITAYGEGETEQEASFALCEALRAIGNR